MAHWVPYVGSYAGVDDDRSYYMLINTFCKAFPHVYVLPGHSSVGLHLIGSMQPIDLSVEKIEERLRAPALARDILEFDNVQASYFAKIAPGPAPSDKLLIVTDDHPLLEFFFLRTALDGGKKMAPYYFW